MANEVVLAYDPSEYLLHHANVLKEEFVEGEWRCLVRYKSSSRAPNEDVWLSKDRVMEITLESLRKMCELSKKYGKAQDQLAQKCRDKARKDRAEYSLAYETMHIEFIATYGSDRGIREYILFHIKERAKPASEQREKPDGGFEFERVTEEELRQEQKLRAKTRAVMLAAEAASSTKRPKP